MRFYFYKIYNPYDGIQSGGTIELQVGTMLYSNSETCAHAMSSEMQKAGQKRKPAMFDVSLRDESVVAGNDGVVKITIEMTNKSAIVNRVQLSEFISNTLAGESVPSRRNAFFPENSSSNRLAEDEFPTIEETDSDIEDNKTFRFPN